jgi:acetylornithine/N-succinyldiaminopimelate aminotransferase
VESNNRTLTIANSFLMPNYGKMNLEIISGKGCYVKVRDENGKTCNCLDFLCGLGVSNLGHCHPAIIEKIIAQSQKLGHVSNLYATEPMAELAMILAAASGLTDPRVFFCNSGTEANEAALKLARIWAHEKYGPQKHKIISLRNSFHGRTMWSITNTGQNKLQDKFAPGVPGTIFVELNDMNALLEAVDDDVCAIIFETIQAEGGINMMSKEFYDRIGYLSQKHNFLRIVDEVQTGMGRTGRLFSFERFVWKRNPEKYPEIITMAKALGGGLPIGAVIANGEVSKYLLPGSHAATFGGNPIICAAALEVMKMVNDEKLMRKVNRLGDYFFENLRKISCEHHEKIVDVRGLGFMLGVELREGQRTAGDVVKKMRECGVIVGTAGPRVVRFLPSLIAEKRHIDKALAIFLESLR